jgi:DNA polymerase I
MEEIYIVDAVNYLFRAYYAIGPMTNNKGQSTSALFGFIRSIQKIIKEFSPKHLICVFDGPDNKKSRLAVYSEYKMNRKGAPEDLFPQFQQAFDYCELAGIPALAINHVEADDTMASIALWAKDKAAKVFLCTSDKDMCQLVDDQIFVLNVHKDNLLIDATKVEELFGVRPDQMLDLLAMMGDKSDNIPGLPGIGPKTASTLLKEFGTLNAILEQPEKLKGKKKDIFIQEKEKALMSRQLATLDTSVVIPQEEHFYALKEPDTESMKQFFTDMNFYSLLKEMGLTKEKEEKKQIPTHYVTIDSEEALDLLLEGLSKSAEICVDTETTSTHPMLANLVGIGLSDRQRYAAYIPLNGALSKEVIYAKCKPLFENKSIAFFGHNIKYDYHVLKNFGITIANIGFDTILASYILNPQNRRHSLDQCVLEIFEVKKTPIQSLIGTGKNQKSMEEVPVEQASNYCCEDVDYTFRLKDYYTSKINGNIPNELFHNLEVPLITVLANMERRGIFLDTEKMDEMNQALVERISALQEEIHEQAGVAFNINSPKQLSEVLYIRLGLKPPTRKKSEYATDAKVLEMLAEESSVVSKVLQYRTLEKLRSTYAGALPKQINPKTGRIHPTFNQSVTATGRLSCQDPNLQNIPIRSEEGRKIREGFRPQKEGWVYLSADYSQIELRLLAHFSEDPALIDAFNRGDDIHAYTASLIFDCPQSQITKEMRSQAKTVNFGILYGQTPYGLSQELGISHKEAAHFIETYFARYPNVLSYLDQSVAYAKNHKNAVTLFERKRPLPEIDSKNPHIRAAAERLAINTPLQGTAADIIKKAMITIEHKIEKESLEGFMILQVHDELIFEIPENEIPQVEKTVKEGMEQSTLLKVPLTVDISIGKNWAEC